METSVRQKEKHEAKRPEAANGGYKTTENRTHEI